VMARVDAERLGVDRGDRVGSHRGRQPSGAGGPRRHPTGTWRCTGGERPGADGSTRPRHAGLQSVLARVVRAMRTAATGTRTPGADHHPRPQRVDEVRRLPRSIWVNAARPAGNRP
jgi:hypothetical protein